MSLGLSFFLIFVVLILYFFKRKTALIYLFVFSLTNNAIQFDVGVAFKLYHLIIILFLPVLISFYYKDRSFRKKTLPIAYDYILMLFLGLIFGFIFKFDDPFSAYRLFTQKPEMRAIISSFRILIELFVVVIIYYWFTYNRLTNELFIKIISYTIIINLLIAVFFYLTNNQIFKLLFPNDRIAYLTGRFCGLNGEPRAFGRNSAFILLLLLFLKNEKNKRLRTTAIISSIFAVLLSMSASAYLVSLTGITIYTLYERNLKLILPAIIFTIFFSSVIYTNYVFQKSTLMKIQYVLKRDENLNDFEKVRFNEPIIFTRFEIFDRAALNFFYNNPKYILFGVGPNLISIPASNYITYSTAKTEIYGFGINTAPATFLVNILSRTGLIGILLWIIFFLKVKKGLQFKEHKYLWLTMIIMNFITASNLFLMITGFMIYYSSSNNNNRLHLKQY